jgi:hypothetical protein
VFVIVDHVDRREDAHRLPERSQLAGADHRRLELSCRDQLKHLRCLTELRSREDLHVDHSRQLLPERLHAAGDHGLGWVVVTRDPKLGQLHPCGLRLGERSRR